MKKLMLIFISYAFPVLSQGTWTQMSNFPGGPRTGAAAFAVGSKGYLGTGTNSLGIDVKDFWEYDPVTDAWTQKTNFGGTARSGAVGLGIGTKGYIGTGSGTSDWWEYNPSTNAWTAKAAYGGGTLSASCGFAFNATLKGYVGGAGLDGNSSITKIFYEYDQATNVWTAKTQPPYGFSTPPTRFAAVGFAVGSMGYICSGMGCCGANAKDLYQYNPATNTWTVRTNYTTGFGLYNATGFGIGTKGYLVTGEDDAGATPQTFRQWEQSTNTWSVTVPFPGTGRQQSASFVVNNCGYVITGRDGTGSLSEVWRFCPPAILPVELTGFTGKNYGTKNLLQWETATEKDNEFFTIERSTDGSNFVPIATVAGSGLSYQKHQYSFADVSFQTSDPVNYYRLKQTDRNRESSYCAMISVQTKLNPKTDLYFDHNAQQLVSMGNFASAEYIIEVLDLPGKCIHSQTLNINSEQSIFRSISLSELPSGLYIARLSSIDGSVLSTIKFVK